MAPSPSTAYAHSKRSSNSSHDGWLWNAIAGKSPQASSKRAFYTEKADSPAFGLRSPRLGLSQSHAPAPTITRRSFLRVILLRPFYLLTRRSPLLPLLLVLSFFLLFSSSTEDATATVAPAPSGRIGRIIAAVPRPGGFNPYQWARARLGREEEDLDFDDEQIGMYAQAQQMPGMQQRLAAGGDVNVHVSRARRRDGRALIVAGRKHPIPGLIRRAKKRWARLNARQSKTFAQAIAEYRKRYGRAPPKGFDHWYAFARANNVRMIDEFDLIERDLHVYRAISPKSLQARVKYLQSKMEFSWGVRVEKGEVTTEGELALHDRARGVVHLMRRFAHTLPDMVMWYNGHDNVRIMIPWEERSRLEQLVADGQYDDDAGDPLFTPKLKGPPPHWGVPQTCAPDSEVRSPHFVYGEASRTWTGLEMPEVPEGALGTVIDSFKRTLDICNSPQYRHFHTVTSWVYPHWPTALLPLFTPGVHGNYNDIHCIITEQFDMEPLHDPTWEERPFDRLVWRGQTSGPFWDKHTPWITSHRSRLHLLSHQETGKRNITVTDKADIAHTVEVSNYLYNPVALDVGMVGPAVQCAEDGSCEEMNRVFQGYEGRLSMDRANLYKYVLDVDGNSWSGRFRRLMLSNAAVVKATIFAEPFTDWIMPWLHYIPISIDYSDLHDVMAFFRGGLRGEGAHDSLAREIALEGRKWAMDHLRYEDLEAYQFRLLLEWGRLWSLDQSDVDYQGLGSKEPVWVEVAEDDDELYHDA